MGTVGRRRGASLGALVALALAAAAGHHAEAPASVGGSLPRRPVAAPAAQRHVTTDTKVEFLDRIHFVGASAEIEPRSIPVLDALVTTLDANRDILVLRVTAYGSDAISEFQEVLAVQRAQAIVAYLVRHGIDARRLWAVGLATSPVGTKGPVFDIVRRRP